MSSDHEACLQEIHQLKKKLQLKESLENHLKQENENLQIQLENLEISDCDKCRALETKLREDVLFAQQEAERCKQLQSDEIESFKRTIQALNEKLSLKEEELRVMREDSVTVTDLNESHNHQLSSQIVILEEKLETQCQEHEQYKADVTQQMNDLKEELEHKTSVLNESNELLKNYKEMLENAQGELANLKSKPQDNNERGNSLFRELEDRRVKAELLLKSGKLKIEVLKKQLKSAKSEKEELLQLYNQAVESQQNSKALKDLELYLNNLETEKNALQSELQNERDNCHFKKDLEQHLSVCENRKEAHEAVGFISDMKNHDMKRMQGILDEVRARYWQVNMTVPRLKMEVNKLKDVNHYLRNKCYTMKKYYSEVAKSTASEDEKENAPSKVEESKPRVLSDAGNTATSASNFSFDLGSVISDLDDVKTIDSQFDMTYEFA